MSDLFTWSMPRIVLLNTGSNEYTAIGSTPIQKPVSPVHRKSSTSRPTAGAACPMFATPMNGGRSSRARPRVTRMPSGTPTTTTMSVTVMVISRCCHTSVATLPALMFTFCVAVRSRLNAQKMTAAATMTTRMGWMIRRSLSATLMEGAGASTAVVIARRPTSPRRLGRPNRCGRHRPALCGGW